MANSYTPPDRSTYDPGWNDPPPMPSMASQTTITAAAKPRTTLNKRVAFPMQSSIATSANVKTTAEGLPLPFSTAKYQPATPPTQPIPAVVPVDEALLPVLPPPMVTPPSSALNPESIPNIQTTATETVTDAFDSVAAKEFSCSIFARLVDGISNDTGKLGEIRKRLEILDQMWQENKLNDASQQILYQFAKALEKKDAMAAMEQHRLLATQHINVSTQWAPALRQLILFISPEIELISHQPAEPVMLSDTNVVQLIDVSTESTVLDQIPIGPPESINPNQLATFDNDNNTISNENTVQLNSENAAASKSKFRRFGRILHL